VDFSVALKKIAAYYFLPIYVYVIPLHLLFYLLRRDTLLTTANIRLFRIQTGALLQTGFCEMNKVVGGNSERALLSYHVALSFE
jgi:hypothetical protein